MPLLGGHQKNPLAMSATGNLGATATGIARNLRSPIQGLYEASTV